MAGMEGLRRVATVLESAGGDPRSRLRRAAADFERTATAAAPGWPVRLQVKADLIRAALHRHGPPDVTIGRLSESAVADALDAIRRFCAEADRADRLVA